MVIYSPSPIRDFVNYDVIQEALFGARAGQLCTVRLLAEIILKLREQYRKAAGLVQKGCWSSAGTKLQGGNTAVVLQKWSLRKRRYLRKNPMCHSWERITLPFPCVKVQHI